MDAILMQEIYSMRSWVVFIFSLLTTTMVARAQVLVPDVAFRYILRENGIDCINDNGILDTLCAAGSNIETLNIQDLVISNYNGLQYFKNLKSLNVKYAGTRPAIAERSNIRQFAPDSLKEITLILYNSFKMPATLLPASCKTFSISRFPWGSGISLEIPSLFNGIETLSFKNEPFPIHGHFNPLTVVFKGVMPPSLSNLYLQNTRISVSGGIAPPPGLKNLELIGGSLGEWCGNETLFNNLEYLMLAGSFYEPLLPTCGIKFGNNLKVIRLLNLDGAQYVPSLKQSLPNLLSLEKLNLYAIHNIEIDFNPLLPSGLKSLGIGSTNYPSAANLPEGLKELYISYTSTKDLDQISFPENLENLTLRWVDFTNIDNLPISLKTLWLDQISGDIDWNKVTFPPALETLKIENIAMHSIDTLRTTVKKLWLSNNMLTQIRHLPNTLEQLDIHFQGNLKNIDADLTNIPISGISFGSLGLTKLPYLPNNLESLKVWGMPYLRCVRPLPESLRFLEWEFSCIPNETDFLKDGNPYPLCDDPSLYLCPESDPVVRGRLYLDVNDNFIFDEGDQPLAFRSFLIEPIKKYVTTKADGTFDFEVSFAENYWINFYGNDHWRSYSFINIYNFSPLYSGFSGDSLLIPFKQTINEKDIEVVAVADPAVPGQEVTVDIIVSDRGNPPTDKASLYLNIPDLWEVVDVTPTPTYADPYQVGWKDFKPKLLERTLFKVRLRVPDNLKPNTAYQLSAKLEDLVEDNYPENNQFIISGRLLESKPDLIKTVDKTFMEKQYYQERELYYMISYQNNSFDTVTHLTITDSLSGFFFKQNYRIIGASHDFKLQMKGNGVMEFTLDNIAIPPYSTDSRNARFWVVFSVQLGFMIPSGSEIINEFKVSEQFSYPTSSNVVSTLVGFKTATHNQQVSPLKLYPNPTSEFFRVEWVNDESFQIHILDINGRQVAQHSELHSGEDIPLGNLKPGMYIIMARSADKSAVGRLIVK
jgi:hypothetical protein